MLVDIVELHPDVAGFEGAARTSSLIAQGDHPFLVGFTIILAVYCECHVSFGFFIFRLVVVIQLGLAVVDRGPGKA